MKGTFPQDRPSYADVEARLAQIVRSLGGEKRKVAQADGYDILALEIPARRTAGGTHLLISAGIHGEEPGSVVGLLDWLETRAARWVEEASFTVLPCLNPFGFERGLREDALGRDLNRHFHPDCGQDPTGPAMVPAVIDYLAGRRFDFLADLHEDWEFNRFYLYEPETESSAPIGEAVVSAMVAYGEASHGEGVGDIQTANGLIRRPFTAGSELLRFFRRWPFAIYALIELTSRSLTVETPGRQPLSVRSRMHQAALDAICSQLVKT